MFDTSRLRKGIDHLYQEINYNDLDKTHEFYKKILLKTPAPTPKFFSNIDQGELSKNLKNGNGKSLTVDDRNYLFIQQLATKDKQPNRATLLTTMRQLSRFYPQDVGLAATFARILIKNEHYGDATFYLQRAIQLAPNNKYAWAHLALIAAIARDHGTALQASRKALELKESLFSTIPKTYVFSMMALGLPAKVGPFDSTPLTINQPIKDQELTIARPEVVYHRVPENLPDRPIIMFACDEVYFNRYGKNQLLSLLQSKKEFGVHVHVVNPSDESLQWMEKYADRYCKNLVISFERVDETLSTNKPYLASCRFINVGDFVRKFNRSYLIVDTDMVLNSPEHLESFFDQINEPAVCYSEHSPIWDTVTASFIYIPNTDVGLSFIDMAQRYLLRIFFTKTTNSFWYVDQVALQGSALAHANNVWLAMNKQVTCRFLSDDSIFWFLSVDKTNSKFHERAKAIAQQYPMD